MAAPKCRGLLYGKGTHTCFGEGVRESRNPLCRRAQPDVLFAVPEERRVKEGGCVRQGIYLSAEPCKSEVQTDLGQNGTCRLVGGNGVLYKS
jgi:hypothetical protein